MYTLVRQFKLAPNLGVFILGGTMATKNEDSSKIGNQGTPSQVNTIKGQPVPQVLPGGQVNSTKTTSVTGDVDHSRPFN